MRKNTAEWLSIIIGYSSLYYLRKIIKKK